MCFQGSISGERGGIAPHIALRRGRIIETDAQALHQRDALRGGKTVCYINALSERS